MLEENFRPTSTEFVSGSELVPGVAVAGQNDTGADATGGLTTTVAVAYFVVSAVLVARTVIVCWAVTDEGAVYRPVDEIDPTDEESDHVTAVLDVPLTVAVNCCVPPGLSVTDDGDAETATAAPGAALNTTSTQ